MTVAEQGADLTAGMLAARTPALSERTTCGEVFDWFIAHPAVPAAAILDSQTGAVLGLINRFIFFASYAKQYVPELFSRKSILKLANQHPLVVDGDVKLADLGATLLVENPDALIECYVVTRRGRYLGVGTGEALLQGKVKLLQAREEELSRALQAETRANAAKSDFLALMSHELRTPLNAILGFSEVIKGELYGPLGHPKYREYAEDVHKSGVHLLDLINDVLDLSKIDAGKMDLRESRFTVAELVAESLLLVRGKAKDHVELRVAVPESLVVFADRRFLKQILLNLLSNAIKFTPAGGVVRINAERLGKGLALHVSDTGIGMSQAEIATAFSHYGQIDSRIARNHEGTGLGLPISKALAELHGGDLVADSTKGVGTTITLLLPEDRVSQSVIAASA